MPSPANPQQPKIASSCSKCRSRKVRCSGSYPCTACLKRGDLCVFPQKLKPGLKKGSGRKLERRVIELEGQLASSRLKNISLTSAQHAIITQLYFQSLHPHHPFLNPDQPLSNLAMHAIVASVLSFVRHDNSAPALIGIDPDEVIDNYTKLALEGAHSSLDLDAIRALTILAWTALRDAHGPGRWLHLMALSRAINVVFNGSVSPFMQRTPIFGIDTRSEQSVCLYWSAFIIDRLASFTTGWSFGITTFDIALPTDGVLRPTVEIFLINDAIHALFSQAIDLSSDAQVREWRGQHDALSAQIDALFTIQSQSQLPPTVALLQHATILRHHSQLAYPPHTTSSFVADGAAQTRCAEASQSISAISSCQSAHITNSTHYNAQLKGESASPLVVWSIWVAARNHLLAYTTTNAANAERGLPMQFYQLVQSLRVLAPTSRLANVYANVLDRITTSDQTCSILATARTSFTVLKDAGDTGDSTLTSDLDVLFHDIVATFV